MNTNDNIYYRAGKNGTWQQIGGELNYASVSDDESNAWDVNSSEQSIYYRAGENSTGQLYSGKLKQLSAEVQVTPFHNVP